MSQYQGGQPPQDPYYGGQPAEPYAPNPAPQQPSDPYFGQGAGDPYGQPQDPAHAQQQAAAYAQQQAWYAQQQAAQGPPPGEAKRGRGGAGAVIVGLLLVLVGVWILFGDEIGLDLGQVWPMVAVAVGIVMVIAAFIPRGKG
jgi:hypothetical protein